MKLLAPFATSRGSRTIGSAFLGVDDFRALLVKERMRVERSGGDLSLLVVTLPLGSNIHSIPRDALRWMLKRLRELDELGFIDNQRFGIVLPATPRSGAAQLMHELRIGDSSGFLTRCMWKVYVQSEMSDSSKKRDDDHHDGNGHVESNGHANGNGHHSGNGVASTNGNGHTNGNGRASDLDRPDGTGTDRRRAHSHGATAVQPVLAPQLNRIAAALPAEGDRLETAPLAELFVQELPLPKRLFDIVGSSLLLVALSPVLAGAAVAVKLSSPGPVFFHQPRMGPRGKTFRFFKFRTMFQDAERRKGELLAFNEASGPVFKMTNDPRITPVGRILRKSSIDELPQLWNVLRGDMSLVGPRPPIPAETLEYEPWQRARLEAPGGITCIWQVSGRSNVGFTDWVRMDIRYLRRWSALLDLSILFRTLPAVILGRGAR